VLGKTEWKIPVFTCQLAQDSTDQPKKLKGIKRLECKLDGVRVLAVIDDGDVTLYSRNGKVFENFPEIEEAIKQHSTKSCWAMAVVTECINAWCWMVRLWAKVFRS
jgi:ATP-dependent DNA ligase